MSHKKEAFEGWYKDNRPTCTDVKIKALIQTVWDAGYDEAYLVFQNIKTNLKTPVRQPFNTGVDIRPCINNDGRSEFARGLCHYCYSKLAKNVREEKATWKYYEDTGKSLPPRRGR